MSRNPSTCPSHQQLRRSSSNSAASSTHDFWSVPQDELNVPEWVKEKHDKIDLDSVEYASEEQASPSSPIGKARLDVVEEQELHQRTNAKEFTPYDSGAINLQQQFISNVVQDDGLAEIIIDKEENPERLLTWLCFYSTGRAFVRTASDEKFTRAFTALDTAVFVDDFRDFMKDTFFKFEKDSHDRDFRFKRSIVRRLHRFQVRIDDLLTIRQDAGHPLTLEVCRHALKCAASIADKRMAEVIWHQLMPMYNLKPDVECYNLYMHAACWNQNWTETARHNVRTTSRNMQLRSRLYRPKPFVGYTAKAEGQIGEPKHTLKSFVLQQFQELTNANLVPNEKTFTTLMLGLAKSKDVSAFESVLKSVWNIDVNALNSFDEEELESPYFYETDHPLKPSSELLYTIVRVYGINSMADKAWSVLDYVARHYAMEIPMHVWNELLRWTFVLSSPRSATRAKQGQSEGAIERSRPETLFNIMTDIPYNVQPNYHMLDYMARSSLRGSKPEKMVEYLRQAHVQLKDDMEHLTLMTTTLFDIAKDPRGLLQDGLVSTEFLLFRRQFEHTFLRTMHGYTTISQNARRFIKVRQTDTVRQWLSQELPNLRKEFAWFLPGNPSSSAESPLVEYEEMTRMLNLASKGYDALSTFRLHTLEKSLSTWVASQESQSTDTDMYPKD